MTDTFRVALQKARRAGTCGERALKALEAAHQNEIDMARATIRELQGFIKERAHASYVAQEILELEARLWTSNGLRPVVTSDTVH